MLLIHAKTFEYKVVEKAIASAESVSKENAEYRTENALVAFVTVERDDEKSIESVAKKAAEEIIEVVKKVKANEVLVYPYAHLSSELASPELALKCLRCLEEAIKSQGIRVHRAPFGWYKSFSMTCFGHPLSELSRTISAEKAVEKPKIEKRYLILTPDGKLIKPEEYKFKPEEQDFKALVEKEALGKQLEGGESRVHYYCRKFGFEWEPYSDSGHMRYQPLAEFMVEAVSRYAWQVVRDLGIPVFKVRGTNMFNLAVKPVREHAELFGDRLYELTVEGSRYVLRFAACHQQFSIIKDWILSYKHLPLGVFEIADSYRLEQRGELVLGFRLRKFTMPDLHILTKDLEEAKKLSIKVHEKILEEIKKIGRSYVSIYNTNERFLKEHFDYVLQLVKMEGKPVLVCLYPEGIYYWVLNIEYNIIDVMGRPREIGTFQIDVGNAKRFGIKYVDEKGEEKYPVIIHTAIIGSIERYLYAILDTAAHMEKEGKTPTIPTWLAPIQVRVIPVSEEYLDYAVAVAKKLQELGIRVDVDDRSESLGKKIRDAGIEWIPYVAVVGKREKETGVMSVTIRRTGERISMKPEELARRILEEVKGYPQLEQTIPMFVSMRPGMMVK